MNNGVPEPVPLPPVATRNSFWFDHRRRPAFLFLLVTGLVLFLIWLPGGARASLWTALSAQRGLVVVAGVVLGSVWGTLAVLVDRYWLALHF